VTIFSTVCACFTGFDSFSRGAGSFCFVIFSTRLLHNLAHRLAVGPRRALMACDHPINGVMGALTRIHSGKSPQFP
jgi:hypothetical protein